MTHAAATWEHWVASGSKSSTSWFDNEPSCHVAMMCSETMQLQSRVPNLTMLILEHSVHIIVRLSCFANIVWRLWFKDSPPTTPPHTGCERPGLWGGGQDVFSKCFGRMAFIFKFKCLSLTPLSAIWKSWREFYTMSLIIIIICPVAPVQDNHAYIQDLD